MHKEATWASRQLPRICMTKPLQRIAGPRAQQVPPEINP